MGFLKQQFDEIRHGGLRAFYRKIFRLTLVFLALPAVLVIRLIRPWIVIRFDRCHNRIGHLAGDLELYLCSRDIGIEVPPRACFDVFCVYHPAANYQLLKMWMRVLNFKPFWFVDSILRMNRLIPGGSVNEINTHGKHADRDIYGYLEQCSPHLEFTAEEQVRGEQALRAIGLPKECRFICLLVRDSAYHNDSSIHTHRNSDIDNYVLMAERMAQRGFYVVRMGSRTQKKIETSNEKIIDYSFSEQNNEFNDLYLGSKCFFCVSTSAGWDNIPCSLFRKPSVFVDFAPLGYIRTWFSNSIVISKKHIDRDSKKELSIREIIERGVSVHDSYESKGVQLVLNTPEEILDVTTELVERLEGTWKPDAADDGLQKRFWELFPSNAQETGSGMKLHGKIRAKYGTDFLRRNHEWFLK